MPQLAAHPRYQQEGAQPPEQAVHRHEGPQALDQAAPVREEPQPPDQSHDPEEPKS